MAQEASKQPPSREERRQAIRALPLIGQVSLLGVRATGAALVDIKRSNPNMYKNVKGQIGSCQDEILVDLEPYIDGQGKFVLSEQVLRGVIARSVITGSTQAAYDVGETMLRVNLLKEMTGLWGDTETGPETGPASTPLEGETE